MVAREMWLWMRPVDVHVAALVAVHVVAQCGCVVTAPVVAHVVVVVIVVAHVTVSVSVVVPVVVHVIVVALVVVIVLMVVPVARKSETGNSSPLDTYRTHKGSRKSKRTKPRYLSCSECERMTFAEGTLH